MRTKPGVNCRLRDRVLPGKTEVALLSCTEQSVFLAAQSGTDDTGFPILRELTRWAFSTGPDLSFLCTPSVMLLNHSCKRIKARRNTVSITTTAQTSRSPGCCEPGSDPSQLAFTGQVDLSAAVMLDKCSSWNGHEGLCSQSEAEEPRHSPSVERRVRNTEGDRKSVV